MSDDEEAALADQLWRMSHGPPKVGSRIQRVKRIHYDAPPSGTLVNPADVTLTAQLRDDLTRRRERMLEALRQQPGWGIYLAPFTGTPAPAPAADPAWTPVAAVPGPYRESDVAAERRAVFLPEVPCICLRCAQIIDADLGVQIAPPGLPRMTVHLRCLEVGDQVQPRPEEDGR